ncbi:S1C family serine protease [Blattabacterium cuenoti]|uniref:S1C family serine protease n=1 Tax=Blattabacterium cuenoti TaxID=1653831 RepID=UPI00163D2D17|nr:trypsin-like peptidase domain-containing protein [Blattabacterium cuenoti]
MNIKKIIFYILISSFISSIVSITIYKKYIEKNLKFFSYISPFTHKDYNTKYDSSNKELVFSHSFYNSQVSNDFTKSVEKALPTVVSIRGIFKKYYKKNNISFFDFFFKRQKYNLNSKDENNYLQYKFIYPEFHGSGVIISSDGYIVTNNHVIKNANLIEITLNDQRSYIAKLIGTDPSSDIALLKINEKKLPFIIFHDSDKVKVGESVLAIGNPFDLNFTVTAGIISAKNRNLGILKGDNPLAMESFFQIDAIINPGNSGGPLVNVFGNLIGINTAISSFTGNFSGYGFALPSNLVKKVVKDIRQYGIVKRAFLGIKGLDPSNIGLYNKYYNNIIIPQNGLIVKEVFTNSSAYYAGIKKGDIIKNINNKSIKNISDIALIIGMKHPGDKIKIIVLRNGIKKIFYVILNDFQHKK